MHEGTSILLKILCISSSLGIIRPTSFKSSMFLPNFPFRNWLYVVTCYAMRWIDGKSIQYTTTTELLIDFYATFLEKIQTWPYSKNQKSVNYVWS